MTQVSQHFLNGGTLFKAHCNTSAVDGLIRHVKLILHVNLAVGCGFRTVQYSTDPCNSEAITTEEMNQTCPIAAIAENLTQQGTHLLDAFLKFDFGCSQSH